MILSSSMKLVGEYQDADALSRLPAIEQEVLFNDAIKTIYQSVLTSCEAAPAIECVSLSHNITADNDEYSSDSGSDLSQIDWDAQQTVDGMLNKVRRLVTSDHTPTKRQIALEYPECQKFLREWGRIFLKDIIFYRRYNVTDTAINQLVLPDRDIAFTGFHDETVYQGRDRPLSLAKFTFHWPGMDGNIEKKVRNCPRLARKRLKIISKSCFC